MATEQKIKVSVGLTARQDVAVSEEAKRLHISYGDIMRRIVDYWMDAQEKARATERIVVLDRARGELRPAR